MKEYAAAVRQSVCPGGAHSWEARSGTGGWRLVG